MADVEAEDQTMEAERQETVQPSEEERQLLLFYQTVDHNLDDFHSPMRTEQSDARILDFLSNKRFLFIYIASETLCFANTVIEFDQAPELGPHAVCLFALKQDASEPTWALAPVEAVSFSRFTKKTFFNALGDDIARKLMPLLRGTTVWSDQLRKDVVGQTHRFLQTLTDLRGQREGRELLYIPVEDAGWVAEKLANEEGKDTVQRLEAVVTQWARQVREVGVRMELSTETESAGLSQEAQLWSAHHSNLLGLKAQLERPDARTVADILHLANSPHAALLSQILEGLALDVASAERNIKLLHVLDEPCRELRTATHFSAAFQRIFFAVRMIWEFCPYYASEERTLGLFRKVSQEIIERCSRAISLDLLYAGQLDAFFAAVNDAVDCGQQWKTTYLQNVAAMPACWQFSSETVFAQIDAFMQRCHDLADICECQAQFGGGEAALRPYLSGVKTTEILSVLQEIQQGFLKRLEALRDSASRILEVKSPSWHSDYKVFKAGMKRLDNLYTNLINFTLEHAAGLRQALEYVAIFRHLARRETIRLHLEKKMEAVNALVLTELHKLEGLARGDPDPLVYPARYAGRAAWVAALLVPLQDVLALYRGLPAQGLPVDERVAEEGLRIETHFRQQIVGCHREFREEYRDFESTIPQRLEHNILVEAEAAGRAGKRTRARARGHVTVNFDSALLAFIAEVEGFQRLQGLNTAAASPKAEDFVANHKERLRVYRENVMMVARDYNEVLDMLSEFEAQLFAEHLAAINGSISRGLRILKWSSQGILDTFVKECKVKCAAAKARIVQYKAANRGVRRRLIALCGHLRVISFDSKRVLELDEFVTVQRETRAHALAVLGEAMQEIENTLAEVYECFIDKGEETQRAWWRYLTEFDALIEDELRSAVKANLAEFLLAVSGDEKSKTNPTKIFKFHIVLQGEGSARGPAFEPSIPQFLAEVERLLQAALGAFGKVTRLPPRMALRRSQRLQELRDSLAREGGRRFSVIQRAFQGVMELPPDMAALSDPYYESALSKALTQDFYDIYGQLKAQTEALQRHLLPWRKASFYQLFSAEGCHKREALAGRDVPIDALRGQLQLYDGLQGEVQEEQTSDDTTCVHLDASRIKNSLINLNYDEQKAFLTRVKEVAVNEVRQLSAAFTDYVRRLGAQSADLPALKAALDLAEELHVAMPIIQRSLVPLEERFRLLDDYMTVFNDEEARLRLRLRDHFEEFVGALETARLRNETVYAEFQKKHMLALEDFEHEIRERKRQIQRDLPIRLGEGLDCASARGQIAVFAAYVAEVHREEQRLDFGFELFRQKYQPIPEIEMLERDVQLLDEFWSLREEWQSRSAPWLSQRIADLDLALCLRTATEFRSRLDALPPACAEWEGYRAFGGDVASFANTVRMLEVLQQPYIKPRHWRQLRELLKEGFDEQRLTLQRALELGLEKVNERAKELSLIALAEFRIEQEVEDVRTRWVAGQVELAALKTGGRMVNPPYAERVVELLEESLLRLGGLKTRPHAAVFAEDIEESEAELTTAAETLELLMLVQRKFVYFTNIFQNISADAVQLAADRTAFAEVHAAMTAYYDAFAETRFLRLCLLTAGLREGLELVLHNLERVQKNMRRFVDEQRAVVPHLHFLREESIFELLGKSRDPEVLNRHAQLLFGGVREFTPASRGRAQELSQARSSAGEALDFAQPVELTGNLRLTVGAVEAELAAALKRSLNEAAEQFEQIFTSPHKAGEKYERLFRALPQQALVLAAQLGWTAHCTSCLSLGTKEDKAEKPKAAKKPRATAKDVWANLKSAYARHLTVLGSLVARQPTPLLRLKTAALIITLSQLHELLDAVSLAGPQTFEWQRQLRFTRLAGDETAVEASLGPTRFEYGWAYHGNAERAVATPLTDRCFLALATALHFGLGGHLHGPTAAGKSETLAELGRSLGRRALTLSCWRDMGVQALERVLRGVAQAGLWGCFDNLFRLRPPTLSLAAAQLRAAVEGRSSGLPLQSELGAAVHKNAAFFITSTVEQGNPPPHARLDALFRPVAMLAPPLPGIAKVLLAAQGFATAEPLSRKLWAFWGLAVPTLPLAMDLRVLKAVIEATDPAQLPAEQLISETTSVEEQRLLLAALRDVLAPQLSGRHLQAFNALTREIFPEAFKAAAEDSAVFNDQADRAFEQLCLDSTDYLIDRLRQLHGLKENRAAVMLAGPAFSGKTTLRRALRIVERLRGREVHVSELCPKALSVEDLYGQVDTGTGESLPGALTALLLQAVEREEAAAETWVVLDGPLHAEWSDCLHGVLDTSRTLALVDGTQLRLCPTARIFFEVGDLAQASPALVSRCGVVCLDAAEVTPQTVKNAFLWKYDARPGESITPVLEDLFAKWFQPLFGRFEQLQPHLCARLAPALVADRVLRLFEMTAAEALASDAADDELLPRLEKAFVFALIWGFGALLVDGGRSTVDSLLRDIESLFPLAGSVFDYGYSAEKNDFFAWEDKIGAGAAQWRPEPHLRFGEFFVDTVETLRLKHVAGLVLEAGLPVMLQGPAGSGKSALLRAVLRQKEEAGLPAAVITLSARSTARSFQEQLEARLSRTTKKKLRPAHGSCAFLLVEDLALAPTDGLGHALAQELLRQLLEYSSFYDPRKVEGVIAVKDTRFAITVDDAQPMCRRLAGKFLRLRLSADPSGSLPRITESLMHFGLQDFDPEEIRPHVPACASFIAHVCREASSAFALRYAKRTIKGLLQISKVNCDSKALLTRLCVHELQRSIGDGQAEKRAAFRALLEEAHAVAFGTPLSDSVPATEQLLFTSLLSPHGYDLFRPPGAEPGLAALLPVFEGPAAELRGGPAPVRLILFDEFVEKVVHLHRCLSMPEENVLLVGERGSGRQSVLRLCAQTMGQAVLPLRDTADLPAAVSQAFASSTPTVLFLDTQTASEALLAEISCFARGGELPLLLGPSAPPIMAEIRAQLQAAHPKEKEEALMDIFFAALRDKVRVVCCAETRGEALATLRQRFKGIVCCATALRIDAWPKRALCAVARRLLPAEERFGPVAPFLADVHTELSERLPVTLPHLIDCCRLFRRRLGEAEAAAGVAAAALTEGLARLEAVRAAVSDLGRRLDAKRHELQKKKSECEAMLFKMEQERRAFEKAQESIAEKETQLQGETRQIEEIARKVEEQLAEALPGLELANERVNSLDNTAIADIKSFLKLKDIRLELILYSIMVLLKEKPEWGTVQRVVADPSFLKRLREIDKDKIGEERIQKLEKYTRQPEIQGSLESYSKSVNTLLQFVRAVEAYVKINLDAEPLRKRARRLHEEQSRKQSELDALKSNLFAAGALNEELGLRHRSLGLELQTLEAEFAVLEDSLARSEKLVVVLGGVQENWETRRDQHIALRAQAFGSMLSTCPLLAYLGPVAAEGRQGVVDACVTPLIAQHDLAGPSSGDAPLLVAEGQMLLWALQGLPADAAATQSAFLVLNCARWPFIIDPQGVAREWLCQALAPDEPRVIDAARQPVDQALRQAAAEDCLLIIDHFSFAFFAELSAFMAGPGADPPLAPLRAQSGFRVVVLCPAASAEECLEAGRWMSMVDFTLPLRAMEEHLLSAAARMLDEKAEAQRTATLRSRLTHEAHLQEQNERLLQTLRAEAPLSLIASQSAFETLSACRAASEEAHVALESLRAAAKKDAGTRENYRAVAATAARLHRALRDIAPLWPSYCFSFADFLQSFCSTLAKVRQQKAEMSAPLPERSRKIALTVRRRMLKKYTHAVRQEDRLAVAFLLAVALVEFDAANTDVARGADTKKKSLAGQRSVEVSDVDVSRRKYFDEEFAAERRLFAELRPPPPAEPAPSLDWLSPAVWALVAQLGQLPTFSGIAGSFIHHTKEWQRFCAAAAPEREPLPVDWGQKVRGFSVLLLLKALRPDRVPFACAQFVDKIFRGLPAAAAPDPERALRQSAKRGLPAPVLVFAGEESEALSAVERLAHRHKAQIRELPWEPGAWAQQVEAARAARQWAILTGAEFSSDFERQFAALCDRERDDGLQLFLILGADARVPPSVERRCVRLYLERPDDIKADLLRLAGELPARVWPEAASFADYRRLAFALCWLHAQLAQQRKLAWARSLPRFADADFAFAEQLLHAVVHGTASGSALFWDRLRQLVIGLGYATRCADASALRALTDLAAEVFRPELLTDKSYRLARARDGVEYRLPADSATGPRGLVPEGAAQHLFKEFSDAIGAFPAAEEGVALIAEPSAAFRLCERRSAEFFGKLGHLEPSLLLPARLPCQARLRALRDHLPPRVDTTELKSGADEAAGDALHDFFWEEVRTFNSEVQHIAATIDRLTAALDGNCPLPQDMQDLLDELARDRAPAAWRRERDCLRTHSWLAWMRERGSQLREWCAAGHLRRVWLAGVAHIPGLLAALRKHDARRLDTSVDALRLEWALIANEASATVPPKEGMYISGLCLQGGSWDSVSGVLAAPPAQETRSMLPLAHIKSADAAKALTRAHVYLCPCYLTAESAEPLLHVPLPFLPSEGNEERNWLRRGTRIVVCPPE